MPAVVLGAEDERSALRVTIASVSERAGDPDWWLQQPAYDDIPDELLVPTPLQTAQDARDNPAHPSHSAIPARAVFQSAALAAYAPDHDVGLPVRVALAEPLPDGLSYRRIDVRRPEAPGAPVGSGPQRPYPQYRLCWRRDVADPALSLRIPLSGDVYLPLADGSYEFFALPRSLDPGDVFPGAATSASASCPGKTIGLPADDRDCRRDRRGDRPDLRAPADVRRGARLGGLRSRSAPSRSRRRPRRTGTPRCSAGTSSRRPGR